MSNFSEFYARDEEIQKAMESARKRASDTPEGECRIREHKGLEKVVAGGRLPDPELGQDAAFCAFLLGKYEEKLKAKEPEWIPINLPFKAGYDHVNDQAVEKDSFTKRGLNKPGTLIEMEDGTRYLIGDINPLGGECDDCPIDKRTIIKRYKVVWSA